MIDKELACTGEQIFVENNFIYLSMMVEKEPEIWIAKFFLLIFNLENYNAQWYLIEKKTSCITEFIWKTQMYVFFRHCKTFEISFSVI